MKAAVSSTGPSKDAPMDPRFGRCSHFVIVDTDTMSFEAIRNDADVLGGGAGIQAAQRVASMGVSAVITGNVGPNAVKTLSAAGIRIYTGGPGTVEELVKGLNDGKLSEPGEATVADKYGMRGGGGRGPGKGGGGGGGAGMGRSGRGR